MNSQSSLLGLICFPSDARSVSASSVVTAHNNNPGTWFKTQRSLKHHLLHAFPIQPRVPCRHCFHASPSASPTSSTTSSHLLFHNQNCCSNYRPVIPSAPSFTRSLSTCLPVVLRAKLHWYYLQTSDRFRRHHHPSRLLGHHNQYHPIRHKSSSPDNYTVLFLHYTISFVLFIGILQQHLVQHVAEHLRSMAATHNQASPPEMLPTPPIGACPELSRCVSTSSSQSHGSSTDGPSRESLGSHQADSRQSSGSYHSRRSDASVQSVGSASHSVDSKGRRRGYMRPQGTYFAASARSRESVMNLGSIAHLQYYFARTGLLDGKGGQLARKKQPRATLDMAALEGDASAPKIVESDADAEPSYTFMGTAPDMTSNDYIASATIGPTPDEDDDDDCFEDSFAESDPGMLPPTVSTYHEKEKHLPKPPSIDELKEDLIASLHEAATTLREAEARKAGTYEGSSSDADTVNMPEENTQGWYELQGMRILDVVTLAIRAAKMYYTAHELPDRLDSIKPEKQVRSDLLAVMEVLKQMAVRGFKGGMKDDDIKTILGWTDSVFDILKKEEQIEAAEKLEKDSWTWLEGDWTGREYERERAFLMSMSPDAEPLPEWTPASLDSTLPTPFLKSMQNGLRLVKLHNAVVQKSRRRFGAIPTFHTDTQKPYRSADNLRYWVKAAELRFEILIKIDALGIVYDNGPNVWMDFEVALLKWCSLVRQEIASELRKT
ncbi:hypothetical protein VHEMI06258 [[Torrubiella] hemipterigena]|uniref:Uncharacterized protein n=1 Tax=[Torrubiella] hemipterigena TaxID=1531966 RepID=A0A0A1T036_9HYPO|nr:hypothetical protein VHEMI06258 [[Torrubiella] hemipterigena]